MYVCVCVCVCVCVKHYPPRPAISVLRNSVAFFNKLEKKKENFLNNKQEKGQQILSVESFV